MAYIPGISDIKTLIPVLSEQLKYDFNIYSLSFLQRRMEYMFKAYNIHVFDVFVNNLKKGMYSDSFLSDFMVKDTELFRDPSFWRMFNKNLINQLPDDKLTFWFPELVSNEELFSLLVCLQYAQKLDNVTIYCNVCKAKTDVSMYSKHVSSELNELNRVNFKHVFSDLKYDDVFEDFNDHIELKNNISVDIKIIEGNFLNNMPSEKVSMVIFRNRMLYYNYKSKPDIEKIICNNISKNGFFVIGNKEVITEYNNNLADCVYSVESVYKVL